MKKKATTESPNASHISSTAEAASRSADQSGSKRKTPFMKAFYAECENREDLMQLDDWSFDRVMRIIQLEASHGIANEIETLRRELVNVFKGDLKVKEVVDEPRWLSLEEAAKKIGCTVKTMKSHLAPSERPKIRSNRIHIDFAGTLNRRFLEAKERQRAPLNKGGHLENLKNQRRKRKSI